MQGQIVIESKSRKSPQEKYNLVDRKNGKVRAFQKGIKITDLSDEANSWYFAFI